MDDLAFSISPKPKRYMVFYREQVLALKISKILDFFV